MSKDDYYVIVYKLLSYLYNCLKKGNYPIDVENLTHDSYTLKIDINEIYWEYIIRTLYECDYIEGVDIIEVCGEILPMIKINRWIAITPKGIDFLESNSAIARAKAFLKEAKEILPWL